MSVEGGVCEWVGGWVAGYVCGEGGWGGGSSWILASCQPHGVTSRGRDGVAGGTSPITDHNNKDFSRLQ